jgi:DNA helicase-2/ATP-dependent DNA helicase PcrA
MGFIPEYISISPWFTFLLRHFVRPYQNCLYIKRVSGISFVQGRSVQGSLESNVQRHYFGKPGQIYSDKVSKFACRVIEKTDGQPLRRFEKIFERLYIDECQDLGAYDLELVEHLLKSSVQVTLVGDHRQATYRTNNAQKNSRYAGKNIIDKFREWEKKGLVKIEIQNHSFRCVQAICDFADQFYPGPISTISKNASFTGHDGIFAVPRSNIDAYIGCYHPQSLRYNKSTAGAPVDAVNFGAAKGMEFERVLIYPHKMLEKFLDTGKVQDAGTALGKIYVAITRARQSVGFVVADQMTQELFPFIQIWHGE